MDVATTELYTIENGTKSFTEYVVRSINKHLYAVKDRSDIIYEGESYQQAKSLYEQADQEVTQPVVSKPLEALTAVYKDQEETQSKISKSTQKTDTVSYNGIEIRIKDNQLINLTNAWKAVGSPNSKRVPKWLELPSAKEFIDSFTKKLKVRISDVLVPVRGRYGGTFAHWQIFLAYAKYLSPGFYMWANQVVRERYGETADPDLM